MGRLKSQTTALNDTQIKKDSYTYQRYEYEDPKNGDLTSRSTSKVETHKIEYGGKTYTYTYTYDERGNISTIAIKDPNGVTKTTRYLYDAANQLIREDNQAAGYTWVWTYDSAGNIQTWTEYGYNATVPTANLTNGTTIYYTYAYEDDDGVWGDPLKYIDDIEIGHDNVGNMLYDATRTYTWEHGRQLKTLTTGGKTWTYTYDANGLRTKRTNGSTTYQYFYTGSQLKKMTVGSNTLLFQYGTTGMPVGLTYNNTRYYYVTNLQGDVVAILNSNKVAVVTYTYDAWGNILTTTDTSGIGLASKNPLRYRGYVYDQETGLYYLQSRYYNPAMGRFISADKYVSTGQGMLGYNMFAYCNNNPVNFVDPNGNSAIVIGLIVGAIIGAGVGFGAAAYVDYCDDGQVFNGSVAWYDYLGATLLGGAVGAASGAGIGYCWSSISSFAGTSFSFGGNAVMLLDGTIIATPAITITGTQIMITTGTLALGGTIFFASNNRPGNNRAQNKQYEDAARRAGYNPKDPQLKMHWSTSISI